MPAPVGIFTDPAFLKHDAGAGHPESADRLRALQPVFAALDPARFRLFTEAAPVSEDQLAEVHSPGHIARVRAACARGFGSLDPDTSVVAASWGAALKAAGAVVDACRRVARGELSRAFCAVRPPGHHAETSRAMGFCLFNNIAIAARALQGEGFAKIAIVDFDVHHGNGTQDIFWEDPNVYYISLHQMPLYPGTGRREERGAGPGLNFTLNLPLPPGSGDEELLATMEGKVATVLRAFAPAFLLVSAGFDGHAADPLAQLRITSEGFGRATRCLADLADELCKGRLVSVLEGGYQLEALAESVAAHLAALAGPA
jgi:acetoin utilization deacetylase AcuC-like enzyme